VSVRRKSVGQHFQHPARRWRENLFPFSGKIGQSVSPHRSACLFAYRQLHDTSIARRAYGEFPLHFERDRKCNKSARLIQGMEFGDCRVVSRCKSLISGVGLHFTLHFADISIIFTEYHGLTRRDVLIKFKDIRGMLNVRLLMIDLCRETVTCMKDTCISL